TTRAQPDLYWHLSEPTSSPIEFTLIEENAIRPILETQILSPSVPGIQRIQLSDYDVRLKLGTEYRWFVAIVADPRRRSKDILAGGFIERIEPPAALEQQLTEERAGQAPFIYAAAGIWYDALAALGKMIHASPGDAQLRAQRAALLDQVGLPEIAISETR
ncbi:MAG TPA: DUF928 domain-containing protein, partial [Terriglobales bacterium]|nr:DUF928 domain-containing protein [Terriglobales bacterium]